MEIRDHRTIVLNSKSSYSKVEVHLLVLTACFCLFFCASLFFVKLVNMFP